MNERLEAVKVYANLHHTVQLWVLKPFLERGKNSGFNIPIGKSEKEKFLQGIEDLKLLGLKVKLTPTQEGREYDETEIITRYSYTIKEVK